MRSDLRLWLTVPLLCIWPVAANAADDDVARLMSECGVADLPQASVDGCLERVRVLEETNPSPQLQTLEASLEQRESAGPARQQAAAAPVPRVVEVVPEPNVRAGEGDELDRSSPQAGAPEEVTPRSGAMFEDEPPVADPPDAPAGTGRMADDDTIDPPQ